MKNYESNQTQCLIHNNERRKTSYIYEKEPLHEKVFGLLKVAVGAVKAGEMLRRCEVSFD